MFLNVNKQVILNVESYFYHYREFHVCFVYYNCFILMISLNPIVITKHN